MKSDRRTPQSGHIHRRHRRWVAVCLVGVAVVASGCTSVPELERQLEQIQFGPHQYRVRPSDTILTVAYRYRMSPDELRRLNPGISEPLQPGYALNVYREPAVIAADARRRQEARTAQRQAARERAVPVVTAAAPAPEPIERRPLATTEPPPRDRYYSDQALLDERAATSAPAGRVMTEQRASVRRDPNAIDSPNRAPQTVGGADVGGAAVGRAPAPATSSPAMRPGPSPGPAADRGAWPREEIMPDPLEPTLGPQREAPRAGASRAVPVPADAGERLAMVDRDRDGFGGRWYWPTDGEVARGFRPDQVGGQGVDIAGAPGQDVRAAMDGTVVYSGRDLSGVGNLVILRHPDNLLSTYSHTDELYVAEDDVVRAGDPIASLGANENRESVLGFEIRRDGNPLNPLEFLPVQ